MEIFLLSKKIWDSGKDIKGMKSGNQKDMKERMCYLGGSNVEQAQDPDWNLGSVTGQPRRVNASKLYHFSYKMTRTITPRMT